MRYEWVVLPQGMANSPTMCQMFVDWAIKPIKHKNKHLIVYHYMDDILLTHPDKTILENLYQDLCKQLEVNGLSIASDKVQMTEIKEFLGSKITSTIVWPIKIILRLDKLKTLNDFQKFLGDLNWVRPYLRLSTSQLAPLFDILKGDSNPSSPRQLTLEARQVIQLIEKAMETTQVDRISTDQPLFFITLADKNAPTGVF